MSIYFDEQNRIFHLTTQHSDYQIKIDIYGYLLHLYYGRKTEENANTVLIYADRGFSGNPYDADRDRTYSMDVLPQEFPVRGTGDYRNVALSLEDTNGTMGCDFRYASHKIYKGKYSLKGLPAVYAKEDEADTLEIKLVDSILQVEVTLLYGVLPEIDCITRSVLVENNSEQTVIVDKAASACLDFVTGDFDVVTFHGRHAMERQYERNNVGHHAVTIGSRRGTSSHQQNPLMILAEKTATEESGRCYAMSFVYSGGFEASVEKDQMNQTRMLMGLESEQLRYRILPGSQWVIPEVICTYSDKGFQELSNQLHQCIRYHVCRGAYQLGPRPVLINSWEASYFDIHGDNLLKLAKEAAQLGMDMLVMDDGWFGKRDDDYSGLGDWYVNEKKLGMPLNELIQGINEAGLKFGIWFEPEMVNEDSDLYRSHPDWALTIPGRNPIRGRSQLLLDFSRAEVVEHIYGQMKELLDHNAIDYIKWDMNRSICDVYSHGERLSGEVLYDYVLGVYDILERLHENYPNILIEGCSGGGGRFDAGMLYYTPQIWCSDNTDAVNRTRIQYGTSFGYPVSAVGAHVSAAPNHQTGRITSLKTRGVVAMAGAFGYELDLSKLSDDDKQEIRQQVERYRELEKLILDGRYYRLSNPFEEKVAAWEMVSKDQTECLFSAVQLEAEGNMPPIFVKLKGLKEHSIYVDEGTLREYSSDVLMEIGMPLPFTMEEYHSEQIHLKLK